MWKERIQIFERTYTASNRTCVVCFVIVRALLSWGTRRVQTRAKVRWNKQHQTFSRHLPSNVKWESDNKYLVSLVVRLVFGHIRHPHPSAEIWNPSHFANTKYIYIYTPKFQFRFRSWDTLCYWRDNSTCFLFGTCCARVRVNVLWIVL